MSILDRMYLPYGRGVGGGGGVAGLRLPFIFRGVEECNDFALNWILLQVTCCYSSLVNGLNPGVISFWSVNYDFLGLCSPERAVCEDIYWCFNNLSRSHHQSLVSNFGITSLHFDTSCNSILSLVQFLFSFVLCSVSYINIKKTKENKNLTKDKIELQHIHFSR